MGIVDGFLNIMRLNPDEGEEDYEDDLYDDDYEDDEPAEKKKFKGLFSRGKRAEEDYYDDEPEPVKSPAPRSTPKITPISHTKKPKGSAGMEVCVFKPTTFEDSREITETLLLNRTVVLNVEGLNIDIAQRIIDFVSGATFAISGNFQKISSYIFVLTPHGIDISGDFQDMLDTFDFAGATR